jgi:hypothetical protein
VVFGVVGGLPATTREATTITTGLLSLMVGFGF